MPLVLWRCWLGGSKGIRPTKNWVVDGGTVICLVGWGANLHMAQLMPLPLTISCSGKSRLVLHFWYRLTRVVVNKGPLNGCCVVVVTQQWCPADGKVTVGLTLHWSCIIDLKWFIRLWAWQTAVHCSIHGTISVISANITDLQARSRFDLSHLVYEANNLCCSIHDKNAREIHKFITYTVVKHKGLNMRHGRSLHGKGTVCVYNQV